MVSASGSLLTRVTIKDPPVPSSPLEASLTCLHSLLSLVSGKTHSINQGSFLNHSLQGLCSVHFGTSVLKMNFYESLYSSVSLKHFII